MVSARKLLSFLDLPPELRDIIYDFSVPGYRCSSIVDGEYHEHVVNDEFCLVLKSPYSSKSPTANDHSKTLVSLLRTCRSNNQELTAIKYKHVTFWFKQSTVTPGKEVVVLNVTFRCMQHICADLPVPWVNNLKRTHKLPLRLYRPVSGKWKATWIRITNRHWTKWYETYAWKGLTAVQRFGLKKVQHYALIRIENVLGSKDMSDSKMKAIFQLVESMYRQASLEEKAEEE